MAGILGIEYKSDMQDSKRNTESVTMLNDTHAVKRKSSRGFTLIASLLMMVLLSGLAIGLIYLTNGAGHVGGNDLESNMAYYGAESAMEKMTADLGALYQANLAPTPAQIQAVATQFPTPAQLPNMTFNDSITWANFPGPPLSTSSVISQGPNAGLSAIITDLTLQASATRPSGANANMNRGVEVAQIPVFQFGIFSDSDLSFFAGPQFDFAGRVHTNGSLYLGSGAQLVLDGKVTAYDQVVRDRLANNYPGAGYAGPVYIPNVTGGCDGYTGTGGPPAGCGTFNVADASYSGAIPVPPIAPGDPNLNANWTNISTSTFNGFIGNNASTGVQQLVLPFVQGGASQNEIIRKVPGAAESPTSPVGASREYNKANIRILLADTVANLHPERGAGALGDGQDIDLTNGGNCGLSYPVVGSGGTTWLACADPTLVGDTNWVAPLGSGGPVKWPLVDGWLRVEYLNAAGTWVGVTTEWLQQGFARTFNPPTTPASDPIHPNAILIFQEKADPNGTLSWGTGGYNVGIGANSEYSFYPINLYDPREGFPHDAKPAGFTASTCYANGVMQATELNVGNLKRWLAGTIGASGTLVDYTPQNGYLIYFSDRRGMLPNPNAAAPYANTLNGESGLEDVINSSSATQMPDGILDPITPGINNGDGRSPEDVDANGLLDRWGSTNIGNAFGIAAGTNPFQAVECFVKQPKVARANKVTGARHVLKLVDGGLNNLPVRPDNGLGGFTVASENPTYIWGNYNSNSTDPFWTNQLAADIPHSAASVIADAVDLLSNNWTDLNSMKYPTSLGSRGAATTYYRLAIAGGKNRNYLQPAAPTSNDQGTDGGVHNFLRLLESWGGSNLYYRGSLVSLYYSQYATGSFKCCALVYGAPTRDFYFDTEFLSPANLPPGTPLLQDVVNLSYWQNFQPY